MDIITNHYDDLGRMSQAAAATIRTMATVNIAKKGYFSLVLTGGRTPSLLYKNLAQENIDSKINWQKTHIFWGDERCVPPNHTDSNFKLAQDTLLDHIDIPAANIHRMPGERKDHEDAAQQYSQSIMDFFKRHCVCMNLPSFDLILLGMGEDGHIASLFPEYTHATNKLVTTTFPQKNTPAITRLTMTLKLINNAECIMMLISGAKKKRIFSEIRRDLEKSLRKYPAAAVCPISKIMWEIAE